MGRIDDARQRVADLVEKSRTGYVNPWFLAMAHVAIGETDAAFHYFERCLDDRTSWAMWLGTEPQLRHLHADPRYLALLRRIRPEMADRLAGARR